MIALGRTAETPRREEITTLHTCGGLLTFSRDRSGSWERCDTCGWRYDFEDGR